MRSQELETHVVRAGGCEIHIDMSEEPFCVEIYRKNAAPVFRGPPFVWKFTGKNAHGHVTRAILYGNSQEKCRPRCCPSRSNTGPLSNRFHNLLNPCLRPLENIAQHWIADP